MDNRINEIRRKISVLRAEMALLEATIRDQIKHDLDCSEAAQSLLSMRTEVTAQIGRWKVAGGGEWLSPVPERLRKGSRPVGGSNRSGAVR
jgi:chorismate mutase